MILCEIVSIAQRCEKCGQWAASPHQTAEGLVVNICVIPLSLRPSPPTTTTATAGGASRSESESTPPGQPSEAATIAVAENQAAAAAVTEAARGVARAAAAIQGGSGAGGMTMRFERGQAAETRGNGKGMPSVTLKLAIDRNGAVDNMAEGPKRFTSQESLDAGEQTGT